LSSATVFAAKNGVDRLNTQQDNSERLTILNWLTQFDYAPQQSDLISRQQAGTGQWFLNAPTYQAWLSSKQATLFCPGIPGAGKTMLASIVIDDITSRFENDDTVGIAYVYCNYRRADEQRAKDLFANLLKQLAQGQTLLPECVKLLYNKHKDRLTRASIKEISEALHTVAAMYSKVFIIVDALDECQVSDDCRSRFLDEVFNLQAKCAVNFMATSRAIPEISERFTGAKLVTISATTEDVRNYVDGHLSQLPSFVRRSPELKEEVVSGIIRAIDGMYVVLYTILETG
jgi:Cdc6-like AAA superfamily ATPase